MENTNPQGSESLNVNQAASAFESLMGDSDEASQGDSDGQTEELQASDEVEQEYAEESEETAPKPRYRVKAAGEEIEVDEEELIKGYQQGADYTKKSQALAEQRKAFEAERGHLEYVKQERQAYAQKLRALDSFLTQQDQGVNLDVLKETDPIGYAVAVAEQSQREKQLAVVRNEQHRLAQQQQAEQQSELQTHLRTQSEKLVSLIPELATPQGDAVRKQIRDYAKSEGWTDQELSSVYDSRAVMSMYKAMKYDQLQKSKPELNKKLQSAPKMMRSGTSAPPTRSSQDKQAMQRLRETGKVSDAAKAFERFF
jgi:hypothetical protein